MPRWSNDPPADLDRFAFRIVRTPAAKPLTAIATSTDVVGCCTHFINNRTIPCEGPPNCPACTEGYSWRWHGYLSAVLTDTLEHVLFEFTAATSETFRTYLKLHNNMRGCHFKASRPSGKPNGRVVIAAKPTDEQRVRLPDPPDIKQILCHIWNVKLNSTKQVSTTRVPFLQVHTSPDNSDGRNRPPTQAK